jgi:hypothetical protein
MPLNLPGSGAAAGGELMTERRYGAPMRLDSPRRLWKPAETEDELPSHAEVKQLRDGLDDLEAVREEVESLAAEKRRADAEEVARWNELWAQFPLTPSHVFRPDAIVDKSGKLYREDDPDGDDAEDQ